MTRYFYSFLLKLSIIDDVILLFIIVI